MASMVIPALIGDKRVGLCLWDGSGLLTLTAKVSQWVHISLVDISAKNSTKDLLFLGIVAQVTRRTVRQVGGRMKDGN